MTRTVEFLFDFASPNAYLAWHALPPVLERTGAELNITPVLLGGLFKLTGNQAPMVAFAGVKGKMDYEMLETRRFIARHGLKKFSMNPHFPVNTLLMMRMLTAAAMEGREGELVELFLPAMWEDGLKMDDPQIVAGVLDDSRFDADTMLTKAQDQSIKDALAENTSAATQRGAFGIPTFFVGDEMFFGKERLGQVEEELAGEES